MKLKPLLIIGIVLALLLLTLSCAQKRKIYIAPKPQPIQQPKPPVVWTVANALQPLAIVPELQDDEPAQTLLDAVDLSLQKFAGMDGASVLHFGGEAVPVSCVADSLKDFRTKLAELGLSKEFFRYVRENFSFYSSTAPQVVFTGYYEPLLHGSRR